MAPFGIPKGYFEAFTTKLIYRLTEEEALPEILTKASKKMPYAVPADYFTQAANHPITKNIAVPYTVPANYFNELPHKILVKTQAKPPAIIRSITHYRKTIIAAASIMGILIFSYLLFQNMYSSKQTSDAITQTAQQKLKKMSTTQLEIFLNATNPTFIDNNALPHTNQPQNTIDLNQLFENISDKDLAKFLDDTGDDETDFLIN